MARVSIKEAARRLGVAEATIRRRLHRGELAGVQVTTAQGFVWLVDLPDMQVSSSLISSDAAPRRPSAESELEALKEMVALLRHELESRNRELESRAREIQELHRLLRESQILAARSHEDEWTPGA